jgi:hypothetical protein
LFFKGVQRVISLGYRCKALLEHENSAYAPAMRGTPLSLVFESENFSENILIPHDLQEIDSYRVNSTFSNCDL